jgi:hypothetical protein
VLTGTDLRVIYRSKKVFAFADDCNIITVADSENLSRLTEILEIFGEISGLVYNVNKTNILLIGDDRLFHKILRISTLINCGRNNCFGL